RLERDEKALILQTSLQGGHARSFIDDPVAYKLAVRESFLDKVLPKEFHRPDRPKTSTQDGGRKSSPMPGRVPLSIHAQDPLLYP
ncbi:hypothetical protein IIA15_11890, partial [candidate division TA06 bacterium]|nr:hypothetical protein [candidate division TA06 bacterium]